MVDIDILRCPFSQLDAEVDALARGFMQLGLKPGQKIVLMVKPSIEFIALTFALFRAGGIIVLIDPGMGMKNIFDCLQQVDPDGFVALDIVQWVRRFSKGKFPNAKLNVLVSPQSMGVMPNYNTVLQKGKKSQAILPESKATDPAAIIFTSGSTGPPKGVLYEHGMFNAQVNMLQEFYNIEPGEIDLPGFPLFALFNCAMGVTTVIPDMNFTQPAKVNPESIRQIIEDHGVTQAFGSPAFWNTVGKEGEKRNYQFNTLKRALSAGGPVPPHVVSSVRKMLAKETADIFTPYGATEALPVASIGGMEVVELTAAQTMEGAGTCVGIPFPGVELKIIEMKDDAIPTIDEIEELPLTEIGEIIVKSPSVTREYYNQEFATRNAKIQDPDQGGFWHRMGDVGYLDQNGFLWFCGRMSHVVETRRGKMYSVCCEAIFEKHPSIYRAALVGMGPKPSQTPAIIIEPLPEYFPESKGAEARFRTEILDIGHENNLTESITHVLFHKSFPVDKRHNVKINRRNWQFGQRRNWGSSLTAK